MNEDFQRLDAIVKDDEASGSVKPETPAKPDGNPDAHDDHGGAEDTHGEGEGHSHPEPATEEKGEKPDGLTGAGDEDHGTDRKADPEKPAKRTHEQKRDYAWDTVTRKNAEYKRRIAELEETNRKLKESVERPLAEKDFKNFSDFSKASMEQMLDARDLRKNEADLEQQRVILDEQEEEIRSQRTAENIDQMFPTPEAKKEYADAVRTATEHGFGKFLYETPQGKDIVDFCDHSPIGAKLIYHLARNPDDFVTLLKDNSRMRLNSRMSVIERAILSRSKAVPNEASHAGKKPEAGALPLTGRLGQSGASSNGDISDEDAIAMIRKFS